MQRKAWALLSDQHCLTGQRQEIAQSQLRRSKMRFIAQRAEPKYKRPLPADSPLGIAF
jgi:hypothetical protein